MVPGKYSSALSGSAVKSVSSALKEALATFSEFAVAVVVLLHTLELGRTEGVQVCLCELL